MVKTNTHAAALDVITQEEWPAVFQVGSSIVFRKGNVGEPGANIQFVAWMDVVQIANIADHGHPRMGQP